MPERRSIANQGLPGGRAIAVGSCSLICLGYMLFPGLSVGSLSFAQSDQGEYKYVSEDKRNPFIPLVTSDGKLLKLDVESENRKGLILEGIIYDKAGISYAIINSKVVKVGDQLGDEQVLKIEHNKVILIKNGQTSEIELKKGEE